METKFNKFNNFKMMKIGNSLNNIKFIKIHSHIKKDHNLNIFFLIFKN